MVIFCYFGITYMDHIRLVGIRELIFRYILIFRCEIGMKRLKVILHRHEGSYGYWSVVNPLCDLLNI